MPFVKDFCLRGWRLEGEEGDTYFVICIDLILSDCRFNAFHFKLKVRVVHGRRTIFRLSSKAKCLSRLDGRVVRALAAHC